MKTKTVRGDELINALKTVLPSDAKVTTKDGNLQRIEIGDVAIVVGAYSIDVTIVDRPTIYMVTFKVGKEEFSKEFTNQDEAESFRDSIKTAHPDCELITIKPGIY